MVGVGGAPEVPVGAGITVKSAGANPMSEERGAEVHPIEMAVISSKSPGEEKRAEHHPPIEEVDERSYDFALMVCMFINNSMPTRRHEHFQRTRLNSDLGFLTKPRASPSVWTQ